MYLERAHTGMGRACLCGLSPRREAWLGVNPDVSDISELSFCFTVASLAIVDFGSERNTCRLCTCELA